MTDLPDAPRERDRSTYNEDVAYDIVSLIVDGKTLDEICDGRHGRPRHKATFFRWRKEQAKFDAMCEEAWLWRVQAMCQEIAAIADDTSQDMVENSKGEKVLDKEHIATKKLRIETRWKMLAVSMPRKYGHVTMGGAAPGDDAKVIEGTAERAAEVKMLTQEALYESVTGWAKKT